MISFQAVQEGVISGAAAPTPLRTAPSLNNREIETASSWRARCLAFVEKDESKEKKRGQKIQHPVGTPGASGEQFDKGVAGEAEAESVGDGPGQGDCRYGQKCRDRDGRFFPLDLAQTGQHQSTDKNQRGRCGEFGYRSHKRCNKQCNGKQQSGNDGGKSGTSACGYTGGGFDIAGDSAGPRQRAEDGSGCVSKEDAIEARDAVIGGDQSGAIGDSYECSDVVEEVDEEKDEDDLKRTNVNCAFDVEMQRGFA